MDQEMFTVFSDKQAFGGVSFYLVFCSLDQGAFSYLLPYHIFSLDLYIFGLMIKFSSCTILCPLQLV